MSESILVLLGLLGMVISVAVKLMCRPIRPRHHDTKRSGNRRR